MSPPTRRPSEVIVIVAYFILIVGFLFIIYMSNRAAQKGEWSGNRLPPVEAAVTLSVTPSPDPTSTPTPLPTMAARDWIVEGEIIDPYEIDLLARTMACEASIRGHGHENGDVWIPDNDEAVRDALASGHIIRERADLLGVPFSEVLTPSEFSCWNDRLLTPEMISRRDDFCDSPYLTLDDCQVFLILAIDIAYGWAPDPMPGATHFYSRCYFEEKGLEPPAWAEDSKKVGCTKCQCFYKLEVR